MPKGSGRRPLPTAVKKLRGNAGKRKLNDKEPAAAVGEPPMPKLSAEAKREWKRIVPELLRLGVLTVVDGKALAAYCHAYARWLQAERDVARYGLVIREPVTTKIGHRLVATRFVRLKRNPAISVAHDAMKLMKSFLVEFGLTPASRSRLKVEQQPPDEDPFDLYVARAIQRTAKHVN